MPTEPVERAREKGNVHNAHEWKQRLSKDPQTNLKSLKDANSTLELAYKISERSGTKWLGTDAD